MSTEIRTVEARLQELEAQCQQTREQFEQAEQRRLLPHKERSRPMNAWIRLLAGAAGFLAVTALLSLVSAPPALTQGTPGSGAPGDPRPATSVEVANTPLPVTGSLNATVSGTVQAQQSGPWSIGIAGTPSVNVANSPTVVVGNGAASPVPVRDAAVPNRQPFQFTFHRPGFLGDSYTVPAGKRLVIRHLNGSAQADTASLFAQTGIQDREYIDPAVRVAMQPQAAPVVVSYVANEEVEVFYPAGHTVISIVVAAGSQSSMPEDTFRLMMSGYLEDVP